MKNKDKKIFMLFVRSALSQYDKYFFIGSKEQLMALIGCLYSTSFIKIERISYQEVKQIPSGVFQIRYFILFTGEVIIRYYAPGDSSFK